MSGRCANDDGDDDDGDDEEEEDVPAILRDS